MVPHIAKEGRSFKGAGLYYLHDKGAWTDKRVAFTHVENLHTQNAEQAFKEMTWIALRSDQIKKQAGIKPGGRKQENPVFHYSLAWHPEQTPTREAMIEAGRASLKTLELEGYQAVMVAHADEPHKHLHIIVNRVHPDTGKMANIDFGKMRLSRWAEEYEKTHGKIYCPQRVENNEQRRQGQYVKYRDPVISTAWRHADNGRAFAAALLEQGYLLCLGDRRDFVVMDAQGKVHNPARHIEGVKVKDIRAKLTDLRKERLPGLEEARARHEAIQTARQERAAARGKKPSTRTGWIQRPEPDRRTFQNKLQWQHIEERAALAGAHQEAREAKERDIIQAQRIEENRRELAEIEARRKAQGFKALLRQLKGEEEADRDRAEALHTMLARSEAILQGALNVVDEDYARKKRDLERRHEAEKQGRFEYERVNEDRQRPTRQGRSLFTPAPQANLRPRPAPGYGRPTASERQARIITGLTGERANPDPGAQTPPLTGLQNRASVRGRFRDAKAPLERPAVPPAHPKDPPEGRQEAERPQEKAKIEQAFGEALIAKAPLERLATDSSLPQGRQEGRPASEAAGRAFGAALAAQDPLERPSVLPTGDEREGTLGAIFAAQTLNPELGRWIDHRRRTLEQRHAAQRARLMKELDKDLFPARQAIDNAANPHISAALRELKAIEERQQAPGLGGRFARMQHPNDRERAEALQRELEEARARRDRALQDLERQKEHHERTRTLRDQQAQEGEVLDIEIARVVESGRVPEVAHQNRPPTPTQAEDPARTGEARGEDEDQDSLEQGRGGRSRER